MSKLMEILVPKINAQTSDAISQPTFGPIDIGGRSTITGSVLLTSDKTAVQVGERFKVKIEVRTNDVNIIEYRVSVDFDPTKFRVVDSDTTTTGTQITLLDSVFTVQDKQRDNAVSDIGRIRLKAVSPNSQPLTVNTQVAEIEFQAQELGSSTIKIVEGSSGTQLIRQAGVGMAYSSNEVSVNIQTQIVTTTGTSTTGTTTSTTTGTQTTGTATTATGQVTGTIPETALGDEIGSLISIFLGLFFILLGSMLVINKEKASKDRDMF